MKALVDSGGKILGASILGARAGEMIAEYALATRNGLTIRDVAATIHAYPTYAYGKRQAADAGSKKKLTSGLIRALRVAFRYRGTGASPSTPGRPEK